MIGTCKMVFMTANGQGVYHLCIILQSRFLWIMFPRCWESFKTLGDTEDTSHSILEVPYTRRQGGTVHSGNRKMPLTAGYPRVESSTFMVACGLYCPVVDQNVWSFQQCMKNLLNWIVSPDSVEFKSGYILNRLSTVEYQNTAI